jgi:glucose/mannose transport system substrate-binding protein
MIAPEVLGDVTLGGHILAMPVNLHRENSLFYNKHIFERFHLAPPATTADLLAACRTLKALGVTPLATAHQGWILRILFNSIALGTLGGPGYAAYFSGKSPETLPRLRDAIVVFREVLDDYTNEDAAEEGFAWTNAASRIHTGDAAMFMHGDWAKGYLEQLGSRPGVDLGVVAAPGAPDFFLYGVDVFAIPEGARNAEGAREFLATIASAAGQVAFNRIKGSSPMRTLTDTDAFDELGRATLRDLRAAKVRMRVRSRRVWDEGFARFAQNRDVDALLRVFADNPPTD